MHKFGGDAGTADPISCVCNRLTPSPGRPSCHHPTIMTTRNIDKAHWRGFLENITLDLVGSGSEAEVGYLALRCRVAEKWLGLFGLNYDPRADAIEIALDGIDHVIDAPRQLLAEIGAAGLESLAIVSANHTSQIVRLRAPLPLASLLPAPGR
jgi:hypothetical protein